MSPQEQLLQTVTDAGGWLDCPRSTALERALEGLERRGAVCSFSAPGNPYRVRVFLRQGSAPCPCHRSAEEHRQFEAEMQQSLRSGARYAALPECDEDVGEIEEKHI